MLFAEVRHTVVIDFDAVSGIERQGRLASHYFRILSHLPEEMLESSGRDNLKDTARSVTGIPKRVLLIAGFEDEIPLLRIHDFITEPCSHTSFKDVAVLILVRVTVEWSSER